MQHILVGFVSYAVLGVRGNNRFQATVGATIRAIGARAEPPYRIWANSDGLSSTCS